jgi:hypothetical protein
VEVIEGAGAGLAEWLPLFLGSGFLGAFIGAVIKALYDRHVSRRVAVAKEAREMLAALGSFRRILHSRRTNTAGGPSDDDVIHGSQAVYNASQLVGDSELDRRVDDYFNVGHLFAAGDPATGFGREGDSYKDVASAVAKIYRANR